MAILWSVLLGVAVAAAATRGAGGGASLPFAVGREILAGGLAAVLGETVFFPVEVAKVRLQAAAASSTLGLAAQLRMQLQTGILASWAAPGVVAGMARALIYHGLRLGLFPAVSRALTVMLADRPHAPVSLATKAYVGAACGALGAALVVRRADLEPDSVRVYPTLIVWCAVASVCARLSQSPLDLVKARMAASPGAYRNSLAALATISSAEGGVLALWRGCGASIVRAAAGSGAQLATYSHVKAAAARLVQARAAEGVRGVPIIVATIVSSAAYVTAAAPADLVKTRLMLGASRPASDAGSATPLYTGPLDCLRRSVRAEGAGVLFRGWGASYARLLPVLLLIFPLLERLRLMFGVGAFE